MVGSALLLAAVLTVPAQAATPAPFTPSTECMACHNGLTNAAGEDVSIGSNWRASMMANAARDPYWQAAVRRETLDHPAAAAAIEDECSACHMPAMRFQQKAAGQKGAVFANLAVPLAVDGVSCSVCHSISPEALGSRESFTAGFRVSQQRTVFGPHAIDAGRRRVMGSASGFSPAAAPHIRSSEVCGTCHTLFTHALDADGKVAGELPEQTPYLEWKESAYPREGTGCQDCHMPPLDGDNAISAVLPKQRPHFSIHEFRGGNFFMPRMLSRYAGDLAVVASPAELDSTARATLDHLRSSAARIAVDGVKLDGDSLTFGVAVTNLAGHKLPSGYPSRRAWLHVTITDAEGRRIFESGAITASGAIRGNDADDDALLFEPHHATIASPEQVQIYESIMVDASGRVTTGLLQGVRYVKDNRVLPRGFDRAAAPHDVAVHGVTDDDFAGGADRTQYSIDAAAAAKPLTISAELLYQPVAYRWAQNLGRTRSAEAERFVRYYDSMAAASSVSLARDERVVQ